MSATITFDDVADLHRKCREICRRLGDLVTEPGEKPVTQKELCERFQTSAKNMSYALTLAAGRPEYHGATGPSGRVMGVIMNPALEEFLTNRFNKTKT